MGDSLTLISHIKTGNSIPSLQVMIDSINALDCSAGKLLCMEMRQTRSLLDSCLSELAADCDNTEIKLITDMVVSLKTSLRRQKLQVNNFFLCIIRSL